MVQMQKKHFAYQYIVVLLSLEVKFNLKILYM